jgi:hypothetical protein
MHQWTWWCLVTTPILVHRWYLLAVSSHVARSKADLWYLFYKNIDPLQEDYHSPKSPPSNVTWIVRFQHLNLGRKATNIQTAAESLLMPITQGDM